MLTLSQLFTKQMKNKRFKNRRESARRYRLPKLLEMYDNKCYWCKEPIIMRREVTPEQVVQEKHGVITFFSGPNLYEFKLASVDHIVELADGGTNDWNNTVPSCWFCNNERSNGKKDLDSEGPSLFNSDPGV